MTIQSVAARLKRRSFAPLLIVATAAIVVVLFVGSFLVAKTFKIPSASKIPTLLVGDVIITSKLSYGLSRHWFPIDLGFPGRILDREPRRGEMVLFRLPRDPAIDYVKRAVGLPGDTVQMKEGRLYLNATIVKREPIPKEHAEGYDGRVAGVPTYRETLPDGISCAIIEVQGDTGFYDNTDVFEVPPGAYFVSGDNRDNSLDSRVASDQCGVSFMPFDDLVAKAEYVLYNARVQSRTLKPIP